MQKRLTGLLLAFALSGAHAHSDEFMAKMVAPHGGTIRMAGAVHLELVRGDSPSVYVTDHASREQDTAGAHGTLRIESAEGTREVPLEPAGGNVLRAAAGEKLDADTPVVVFVQLKGAQAETARFLPKPAKAEHAGH